MGMGRRGVGLVVSRWPGLRRFLSVPSARPNHLGPARGGGRRCSRWRDPGASRGAGRAVAGRLRGAERCGWGDGGGVGEVGVWSVAFGFGGGPEAPASRVSLPRPQPNQPLGHLAACQARWGPAPHPAALVTKQVCGSADPLTVRSSSSADAIRGFSTPRIPPQSPPAGPSTPSARGLVVLCQPAAKAGFGARLAPPSGRPRARERDGSMLQLVRKPGGEPPAHPTPRCGARRSPPPKPANAFRCWKARPQTKNQSGEARPGPAPSASPQAPARPAPPGPAPR